MPPVPNRPQAQTLLLSLNSLCRYVLNGTLVYIFNTRVPGNIIAHSIQFVISEAFSPIILARRPSSCRRPGSGVHVVSIGVSIPILIAASMCRMMWEKKTAVNGRYVDHFLQRCTKKACLSAKLFDRRVNTVE